MKCSDLQFNLSLYPGDLAADELSAVDAHLSTCPVCRQISADLHTLRQQLRSLSSQNVPLTLERRIQESLRDASASAPTRKSLISQAMGLLEIRITPYLVGTAASVIIGLTVLASLFSAGMLSPGSPAP